MKRITSLALAMMLTLGFTLALEQSSSDGYTIATHWGAGGQSITVSDQHLDSTTAQAAIGSFEVSTEEAGIGLFYLAIVSNVAGATPAAPLLDFVLYVKEVGVEYIWLNWSG